MSIDQGRLYDHQYDESVYDEQGLPDRKIVDYRLTRNKKILVLGCGMGADVWFLTKNNQVYGLDLSKVAIRVARKHGLIAKVADVTKKIPYQSDNFDIVVCKDVLEHVLDPITLLLEIKRVTDKKGYIIISLPNHFWWWFRIRILFGKNLLWKTLQHDHTKDQQEWNYMHVRFFTWSGVKEMLKVTNLKVIKGYWDFGTWAHYSDPEMFYQVLSSKKRKTNAAKLFLYIVYPVYAFINYMFPKSVRSYLVSKNPGLLCAGFYIKVKK